MKNKIAYYLEDPKRLDEVTLHELNRWIEEMPYSQPLRLLADMKSDRFVANQDEQIGTYGAFFAEDYEWSNKQKGNDKPKVKEVAGAVAMESVTTPVSETAAVANATDEAADAIADAESVKTPAEDLPNSVTEIMHPLAADDREDSVLEEVLETNEVVEVVYEVAHTEASDIEENEIDRIVLELDWEEVEEVFALSQLDQKEEVVVEPESAVDEWMGNVNYGSFVSSYEPNTVKSIEDNIVEGTPNTTDTADDDTAPVKKRLPKKKDISSEKQDGKKKRKEGSIKVKEESAKPQSSMDEEISPKGEIVKAKSAKKAKSKLKKKSNKEDKDDKKVKSRKSRDADSPSKSMKMDNRVEKKKKGKRKEKIKANKVGEKSDKKVLSKALKKADVKAKIKHGKKENAILISEGGGRSKANKTTSKKKKKTGVTTLIAVADPVKNDFKLKNYDGVSQYTNWLLQQKTVNGDHPIIGEEVVNFDLNMGDKEREVAKKKKKKSKEESKTAKAAKKSVKKAEVIISEPLADILAAQGHDKKARKMYNQLSLIFPEKSAYFAVKIENLKKI